MYYFNVHQLFRYELYQQSLHHQVALLWILFLQTWIISFGGFHQSLKMLILLGYYGIFKSSNNKIFNGIDSDPRDILKLTET